LTVNRTQHLQLMASYNEWMNDKLYAAAATLSDEQLFADKQAFFGSLFNTLNHLVAADIIWLKRFARHPANWPSLAPVTRLDDPQGLAKRLFDQLDELTTHRQWLDRLIIDWTAELSDADLDVTLHYANTAGVQHRRNFYALLTHFFNHQTHHRGQATTLLSQAGVDIGSTDLLALIANEAEG
jgi:uncharacterized damage-inducible protein DinB